jgi:hypothetical protein
MVRNRHHGQRLNAEELDGRRSYKPRVPHEPLGIIVDRWLGRHLLVPIALLVVASLALTLPAAAAKPFWHDEIYTILTSRLPSLAAMWRAALDGVDLSPPLNLWLTRTVHAVTGVGPIATRLPALAGFFLTVSLVFLILLRRAGPTAALAGALVPFFTAGLRYAYEARPYGVMMGLSALAIFAWMEAAGGRRRRVNLALLGAALAASIWNHYFGVMAFAPVAAGEVVRTIQRRRLDWGVAAACALALVAAAPLYPLIGVAADQGGTFWAQAAMAQPAEAYRYVLNALLTTPIAAAAAAIALIIGFASLLRTGAADTRRRIPAHEAVAVATAVAIPLLALLAGRLVTGVFVPRYGLGAVAGASLAVPLIVWRLNVRRAPAELVLCGTLLWVVGASVLATAQRPHQVMPDPVAARPVFLSSLRSPGPTVVSSSLHFAQLWYYTPPEFQARLRYLADPDQALERTGADTIDRGYLALARWRRVPVEPYGRFVADYPDFRVYESGSGWLLGKLADSGASIEEIASEPGGRLYQVRIPAGAHR